jgi:PIN domain nuclease of toxin-antitoxin system
MPTRALLDTHSFLWFIGGDERLSRRSRALIESRSNPMFVSAASLWEIAIKHGLGKLALDRPFAELIPEQLARQQNRRAWPRDGSHGRIRRSPLHHRDPFDR